ncbi:unnamed protein product [Calypogeia fissa]
MIAVPSAVKSPPFPSDFRNYWSGFVTSYMVSYLEDVDSFAEIRCIKASFTWAWRLASQVRMKLSHSLPIGGGCKDRRYLQRK